MYVCVCIYIGIESLACEGRVPLACPRGQSVEPLPKGQRQRLLKSPLCSDLKYYYTMSKFSKVSALGNDV